MTKKDWIITVIIAILCLVIIIYTANDLYSQETFIKDGNTFTLIQESEKARRLREGDREYRIIDGQLVPIKIIKAKDFIPTGEILPIQSVEDADGDGNTDFVVVRTDTNVRIAKDIKPKEVMYAGPDSN